MPWLDIKIAHYMHYSYNQHNNDNNGYQVLKSNITTNTSLR